MNQVLLVLVTAPEAAADALATALVEQRLAACVNCLPAVRSTYRWRGAVEHAAETLLLVKTSTARFPALQDAVLKLHPYELPELVAVSVDAGLPAYLDWVAAACAETEPELK
ncbi:MAG: divalent-cation tolerance protein CutA [Gammaproteobacteria bacterium]|nr:divalent-cation tolerance protein CutA [Gammaproteobacteria bacterium]